MTLDRLHNLSSARRLTCSLFSLFFIRELRMMMVL